MSQLGFTFYPKDWWTSDTFFTLSAEERYIYLEMLFLMYSNDGSIENNKLMVGARLRMDISNESWINVTSRLIELDGNLTHKSVNKRLKKAIANRENGKKGGRPKKEVEKPKKPNLETHEKTQKNPPLEREREREREREIKEKSTDVDKKVNNITPDVFQDVWRLKKLYEQNEKLISAVSENYSLSKNEVLLNLEKFTKELESSGRLQETWQEYAAYFKNCIARGKFKAEKSKPKSPTSNITF